MTREWSCRVLRAGLSTISRSDAKTAQVDCETRRHVQESSNRDAIIDDKLARDGDAPLAGRYLRAARMRDLRADLAASTQATTAHGRLMMAGSDLRDEIPRLEERIEDLAEAIARSRRLLQISKIAIAVAAIWILATIAGAIGFDPAAIISAMAAMIGGVVLFGSTTTTLKQTSAAMKEAEAQRAELIGKIELRVVGESRTEHH
jgi:hypothetical protein